MSDSAPDSARAPTVPLPATGIYRGQVHHFPIRVYYEDTDLSGIVYHANYLRFMERARTDMIQIIGIDQRRAVEDGAGVYAVAKVELNFLRPAKLQDALVVRSWLVGLKAASSVIRQQIWRDDTQLTDATVTAAFISLDGRPRRQPAEWMTAYAPYLMAG